MKLEGTSRTFVFLIAVVAGAALLQLGANALGLRLPFWLLPVIAGISAVFILRPRS